MDGSSATHIILKKKTTPKIKSITLIIIIFCPHNCSNILQHFLTKSFVPIDNCMPCRFSKHCYIYFDILCKTDATTTSTGVPTAPLMHRQTHMHHLAFQCKAGQQRKKEDARKKLNREADGGTQWEKGVVVPSQVTPISHPAKFDSPQVRVAFGCLTEEMVEKVSGVEVAQHDCRMRTWSSWSANPWLR